MATQGLLSIVQNGKVEWKIITGSDGYNIPKLAYLIAAEGVSESIDALHELAVTYLPDEYMYVLGVNAWRSMSKQVPPVMYAITFNRPEFNPRWHHGTADYAMIYDADSDTMKVVRKVEPAAAGLFEIED